MHHIYVRSNIEFKNKYVSHNMIGLNRVVHNSIWVQQEDNIYIPASIKVTCMNYFLNWITVDFDLNNALAFY